MASIRVVAATGRGPTHTAAFDDALAAVDAHDYNLIDLSSVVPPDATIERCERLPDLGPIGGGLCVVRASATVAPDADRPVGAAVGWDRTASGAGVFYEEEGPDPAAVERRVREGIAHARAIRPDRDWDGDPTVVTSRADPGSAVGAAVVLAAVGRAHSLLGRSPRAGDL
ncbi:pyruvoyl-dependent arginine decarboxylase [Halococcoides cellulosivorans]|uniref:arginine decarboxylase n=1 Tax=Halococcoides cellulosivorans TaxID=1679096 RepID=A0A2R4WYM7_9EURY|nr:pyruvoyl-dependent arginine decarboxylase [Halococcoides cellulosivorans]AWB26632.1 pyruvoyl-dependent arginine decarboxylase [Halococcoides cellulosivorans]